MIINAAAYNIIEETCLHNTYLYIRAGTHVIYEDKSSNEIKVKSTQLELWTGVVGNIDFRRKFHCNNKLSFE